MKRTAISLFAISIVASFAPWGAIAVKAENKFSKIIFEGFRSKSDATDEDDSTSASQIPEKIAEVNLRICFDYSFEGLSKEEVTDAERFETDRENSAGNSMRSATPPGRKS